MSGCPHKQANGERPVDALLDGDLTPGEKTRIEDHVANCSSCAETLEVVQGTKDAWSEQPDAKMSPEMQARIETKLLASLEEDKPLSNQAGVSSSAVHRSRRWTYYMAGVAAAAAVVIAVVLGLSNSESQRDLPISASDSPASGDGKIAPRAPSASSFEAIVLNVLGDGGQLEPAGDTGGAVVASQSVGTERTMTLGEDTSVRLKFRDFATAVFSDGAVFKLVSQPGVKGFALEQGISAVQVDSNALEGTFKVLTPAGEVEVMGTTFWVSVSPSSELQVAVLESSVKVRHPADPHNVVSVAAGQVLSVGWSNPNSKPEPISPELDVKIRGVLNMFDEASFPVAPDELNNDKIPSKPLTGKRSSMKRTADVEALFVQATSARKQGNINGAATFYRQVLGMRGQGESRAEAAFNLGQMYYSAGNIASSERVLSAHSKVLQKSSYRTMALFYLAKARCKMGKYREARPVIDAFFAHSSNHSMASSMKKLKDTCHE